MPRETISLLSSSPEPVIKLPPKSCVNKTVIASTKAPPNPNTKIAPSNEWLEISSDDGDLPKLRPSKNAINAQTKTTESIASNVLLPPLSSDDFPYSLPSLSSHLLSKLPPKSTELANPLKRDRDLYYLSEDFDTTIDLDKSVNNIREPPAKKARESSSTFTKAVMADQKKSISSSGILKKASSSSYNRSHSNIETSSKTNAPTLKNASTASTGKIQESDPIMFTSSPDPYVEAAKRKAAKRKAGAGLNLANGFGPLPDLSSDPAVSSDIEPLPVLSKSKSKFARTEWDKYQAEREKQKQKRTKKPDTSGTAIDEKENKAAAKEVENQKKLLAKEEKARDKEEKVKEKERAAELAKVNTLRTDKKVSAPEMVVDLPSSLDPKIRVQTEALLEGFKIDHRSWESQLPVVKFQRKVNVVYNEDLELFEPVPIHVKDEKHVIYVMTAQEFVDQVTRDEEKNFDIFILQLKAKFDGCQIIMLIQGFNLLIRKNRNIKNRQFTQAVRAAGSQLEEAAPTANQRRKKKEAEYVNEELLEDAIFRLQVVHELLVHHTNLQHETAEQIAVFTQHISTIPYKAQRQPSNITFCMESGQVKTGDGPSDTYIKMLQEIVRLTAPIAYGISMKYPTVGSLIEGCLKEGQGVVEECRKSANKDGAFTDRKVGLAISKRVWKVFTGRDVNSLDV